MRRFSDLVREIRRYNKEQTAGSTRCHRRNGWGSGWHGEVPDRGGFAWRRLLQGVCRLVMIAVSLISPSLSHSCYTLSQNGC